MDRSFLFNTKLRRFCVPHLYELPIYLPFLPIGGLKRSPRQYRAGESVCSVKEILIFWNLHVYVNRQVVLSLGYVARMKYGGYFGFDDFAFHTIFQL